MALGKFWYPVRQVVSFKRDVYRKVMKEFASILFTDNPLMFSASREANSQHYSANKNILRQNTRNAIFINQEVNNVHLYSSLFTCWRISGFSCRIIWYRRWVSNCANVSVFTALL